MVEFLHLSRMLNSSWTWTGARNPDWFASKWSVCIVKCPITPPCKPVTFSSFQLRSADVLKIKPHIFFMPTSTLFDFNMQICAVDQQAVLMVLTSLLTLSGGINDSKEKISKKSGELSWLARASRFPADTLAVSLPDTPVSHVSNRHIAEFLGPHTQQRCVDELSVPLPDMIRPSDTRLIKYHCA